MAKKTREEINATRKANARKRLLDAVKAMPGVLWKEHTDAKLLTITSMNIYHYRDAELAGEIICRKTDCNTATGTGWFINEVPEHNCNEVESKAEVNKFNGKQQVHQSNCRRQNV